MEDSKESNNRGASYENNTDLSQLIVHPMRIHDKKLIQGMTKKFSQSDKKIFTKWQKNFHKMTKKISQNFYKNNKYDCLFLFEIIKKN